ncbi:MAG: hypothetical protein IJJ33_02280, partial [Victivallales bacterium]|nr:hypothetical protein [Victivallales bacterium]
KPVRIAFIWKNGGRASLYFNGKLAGSGEPFHFPVARQLQALQLLSGNGTSGWGTLDGSCYLKNLFLIKGKTEIADLERLDTAMSSAAVPPAATTSNSDSSAPSLPMIPFPLLKKGESVPALDAVVNPGEYPFQQTGLLHERTGLLAAQPATFHTAADDQFLYIASTFDIRRKTYEPVSSSAIPDDTALVSSGDLAIWFSRTDLDGTAKAYQGTYITIAPNNTVYDAAEEIDWRRNRCVRDRSVSTGVRTASRFENGCWTVEAAIPRASLSLPVGTDFLFSFGFMVDNRSYMLRAHTYWYDDVDAPVVGRFTQAPVRCDFVSPAAGVIEGNLAAEGEVSLAVAEARSLTSAQAMVVDQVLGESTAYTPIQEVKNWKASGQLHFELDRRVQGLHLFMAEAKDKTGQVIYRRSVPFLARRPLELSLENNPIASRLTAVVEFPGVTLAKGAETVGELCGQDGTALQKATAVASEDAPAEQRLTFDTTALPVGEYRIRVTAADETVEDAWRKKPRPEWLEHPVAMEALSPDWVPKPWSPVTVDGQTVAVWGRHFLFGEGGLLAVESQNGAIVPNPLALVYESVGRQHRVPLKTEGIRQLGKGLVEVTVAGEDEMLRARFRHAIEFDGLDWVDVSIAPVDSRELTRLYLELPVADARWVMTLYDYCSQHLGPIRDLSLGRMTAIWLGGEYRGVNTLFENSKGLVIDSRQPRFQLNKTGQDTATLKIMLQNVPARLENALQWRFGLHPTPVKELYKGWEAERPFMMEWFAPPFNFICAHTHQHAASSTDFKPRSWELGEALGNLAKTNHQKYYPYTIATFTSREDAIRPEAPFIRTRLPDSWFYDPAKRPQNQDYLDYAADWNFQPLSTFPGDGYRHTEMIACSPASSWSDYAVFMMNRYMKRCGFAGFYFDLTTTRENFDANRGYRYQTRDGKTEGTRELTATRRLFKRLYYAFAEASGGVEPTIFAHGYPILTSASAFWGVAIHGEELKPKELLGLTKMTMVREQEATPVMTGAPKDAPVDYSGDLFRLQYSCYRWGIPQIHLSQYAFDRRWSSDPRSGRELLALCFPHNTLWDPSYAEWKTGERFHFRVTMPYGMDNTEFHGYWDNGIQANVPYVKVSYWQKKDRPDDILIAVANWSMKTATAEITLPEHLTNAQYVFEMETVNTRNCWYDITPPWRLSIPPCDLRVFRLVGKKPRK